MEKAKVKIRDGEPGDFNFIISTWLRSYKHSSYFAKRIRNSIFFLFHHEVVSRILERNEDTKVFVACDLVDPNVIYGYLVQGSYEGGAVIHYVYVKSAFRQMGIARALATAAPFSLDKFSFSHWTFSTDWIIEKLPNAVYIPYLI